MQTVPDFFSKKPLFGGKYDIPGLYLDEHYTGEGRHYVVTFTCCAKAQQSPYRRNTLPVTMSIHCGIEELVEEIVRPHKSDLSPELRRQVLVLRRWRTYLESKGHVLPWSGERMS